MNKGMFWNNNMKSGGSLQESQSEGNGGRGYLHSKNENLTLMNFILSTGSAKLNYVSQKQIF